MSQTIKTPKGGNTMFFVQEFKCDFCNWNRETALLPNGEAICIPCYDSFVGE